MMPWTKSRLGDVCQIKPPKSETNKLLSENDPVSFVPMNNLGIDTKDLILNENRKLSEVIGSYTYFRDNDVLLAKITPCFENGKLGIARNLTNGVGFGSSEFIVFRPNKALITEYLYYFLLRPSFREKGKGVMTGAVGHKRVPKDFIENTEIPLPPLKEQKRIVAVLDRAFADIERARELTEKNLQNARELFEGYLQQMFNDRSSEWGKFTLWELLEKGWIVSHLDGNHGGDYPRKSEFIDCGVPYISANCLINGEIDFSKAKYLSNERAGQLRKGIAKNDDVIFAHNATVGPVAILKTDERKVILGTSLTYYRCDQDYILPEYLSQYMKTSEFTSQYKGIMRQSTRNQVPITKQREFFHVIPPVEKQHGLAEFLSELSERLGELESVYMAKLGALEELKRSLLQKAFSGELTASEKIPMEEAAA